MNTVNTKYLEFVTPIIEAAQRTFETMAYSKIEVGSPQMKIEGRSLGDVSAMIGMSGKSDQGDIRGMLVLSWPKETYLNLVSAMLGEKHKEISKEIRDAGAELVNMIYGNSKRKLAEKGYSFDMSIPSTVEGKDHRLSYPAGTTTVIIQINSAHGPFFMELCYNL